MSTRQPRPRPVQCMPHPFDAEFALAEDRDQSASELDERRQVLGRLLSFMARAGRAVTSIEMAAACDVPHLRVLNLVGHLKREGVLHASLIAGTRCNYYLIHALSKAPIRRSDPPGGSSRATPDPC